MSHKILVADDEPDVLEFMRYNLEKEGYSVITATDGLEALESAKQHQPDLIILDVMMPRQDGIETCKELRAHPLFSDTIITFLTARNEDYSKVAGLESGADDYLTKPIKPRVLLAKIKSLLRRVESAGGQNLLQVGDIEVNPERFLVTKAGKEVTLPKKEFELLLLLMSNPGKVFTRSTIMDRVWGVDASAGDRTIDVHIRKLREKLGDHRFVTIKRVGYKFE